MIRDCVFPSLMGNPEGGDSPPNLVLWKVLTSFYDSAAVVGRTPMEQIQTLRVSVCLAETGLASVLKS